MTTANLLIAQRVAHLLYPTASLIARSTALTSKNSVSKARLGQKFMEKSV